MKYRPAQYAEALESAVRGKKDKDQHEIIKNFVRVLARHRVLGKARAIIHAYEKLTLRRQGVRKVRMETAGPASEELKKNIREMLDSKIHLEEIENPAILAGVKILVDDEILIDASAKKKLDLMLRP